MFRGTYLVQNVLYLMSPPCQCSSMSSPRKGSKYALLLDVGLCKRVHVEDLGNNRHHSPWLVSVQKGGRKTFTKSVHAIKGDFIGPTGLSVVNDPLPPRHKRGLGSPYNQHSCGRWCPGYGFHLPGAIREWCTCPFQSLQFPMMAYIWQSSPLCVVCPH